MSTPTTQRVRVLVVDDSTTIREFLAEAIDDDPRFVVVGKAANGEQAIELVEKLRPDVVLLDMVMPKLDGAGVTEWVMANRPTPILVCSASMNRGEVFRTCDALDRGAVDVIEKPGGSHDSPDFVPRLLSALQTVSRIRVISRPRGLRPALPVASSPSALPSPPQGDLPRGPFDLIAIAASTGGPGALSRLLAAIEDVPLPVAIVLHLDAAFGSGFADWLGTQVRRKVTFATSGQALGGRNAVVAPGGKHLELRDRHWHLSDAAERNFCRPSADVLFESLARDTTLRVIGCVLTGMGADGASGLLALRRAGALTLVQDEATSLVFGMPSAAINAGAAQRVLPLQEFGAAIRAAIGRPGEVR
ncbi:MAG: chemotaxis-specific protein-glutamate methyltransferase CheB [Planctomycetota bacterium]